MAEAAAGKKKRGKVKTLSSHVLSLELSFSETLNLMVEKEMLTLMGMTVITRLLKSHKLDLSTVIYLIVVEL